MNCKQLELKLPTDYNNDELKEIISKTIKTSEFSYEILKKSLDARNKRNIHWELKINVISNDIQGECYKESPVLEISYKNRNKKVVIIGSGPAGFFAGMVLKKLGYDVTILEQGVDVDTRQKDIAVFESGGVFKNNSNYCFGEGGAGTFSDGKLTCRTKNINLEKKFVFDTYVRAGAPEEILYLNHPHIGSDNLRCVIKNLRYNFKNLDGKMEFDSKVVKINKNSENNKILSVSANNKEYEADYFIFATGNSSYDTYKLLNNAGVKFRNKPFAIGVRVEHLREDINKAQWGGSVSLPGVKSAEYRLTSRANNDFPVYTFCMCPGGFVVPSGSYKGLNVVNGISNYKRDGKFSNSAVVVGVNLNDISPMESLDWVSGLEKKAFNINNDYSVPYNEIECFLKEKITTKKRETSYPFSLIPYDFNEIFSNDIIFALKQGLLDFSKKIKGFEKGIMLGIETKTSTPIQVMRDENKKCEGFDNLYMIGEGSGYSGGIVSSAVEGVKMVMSLV